MYLEEETYIENLLKNMENMFSKETRLKFKKNKEKYSQYYTSLNLAIYMSSLFEEPKNKTITLLDPCCGDGVLVTAFLLNILRSNTKVENINIIMYEIDSNTIKLLSENIDYILKHIQKKNIKVSYEIRNKNFIQSFNENEKFNYIILNPPYKKLNNKSEDSLKLKEINIKVPNYYAAFISICKRLLVNDGEFVAITPRSFCNGTYYLRFREDLLNDVIFNKIHLFESRKDIFRHDGILQENIIYHCIKRKSNKDLEVQLIYSTDDLLKDMYIIDRRYEDVIFTSDTKYIIRIFKDRIDKEVSDKINSLGGNLNILEIDVSTGPVVDFRQDKWNLTKDCLDDNSIPIFFSEHIYSNNIIWPKENLKKFNYISCGDNNRGLLRKSGNYVVVKRMTSKEEKRRIISAVCEGERYSEKFITFDNKVNYFHRNKGGIPKVIARGLSIYLNSTIIDTYFRTFSGNTQVNVSDLKSLKYPTEEQLIQLGKKYKEIYNNIELIDQVIDETLFNG